MRAKRIFAIALLISLLLHVVLLTGVRFTLPADDEPATVIEARILPLPVPPPQPVATRPVPKPVHRPKPHPKPRLHSTPPPAVLAVPAMPAEQSQPVEPGIAQAPAVPDDTSQPAEAAPAVDTPTLNTLPGKLEIQYKVVKGADGFGIGRASYIWVTEGGHYTLTSITEGTGIFSLFLPGRLVQISQGRITRFGLAPDDFWIQRGHATPDKSTAAHFDYEHHVVTITKNNQAFSVPMPDNAQDVLSVVFQLAVRSPFPDEMLLHVTTGKSLKPYHAKVIGEETLSTALGDLKTLHLSRPAEEDEDAMDVWLAEDYNFVPVKIRVDHSRYGIIEQLITGMKNN
ncbi:MAG: DUF3108 domain-containing protein [Sulfuriferula sp.]|nr:DUF3108 domain-containing protein [Sulfuriferula sp.]